MSDGSCHKWFAESHARDFSREGATGRPVAVESLEDQMLTEDRARYATPEPANLFKGSKSSLKNHLHQQGYVNRFDVWVAQQ